MAEEKPHIIPSIYLSNYLNEFEEMLLEYGAKKKKIKKGEYLTKVHPVSQVIPLSQTELASIAGASQAQMKKAVKIPVIAVGRINDVEVAESVLEVGKAEDAKTIPIIALSANAYIEDIQSSLNAGMNEHLTKPVEIEVLRNTLEKFC